MHFDTEAARKLSIASLAKHVPGEFEPELCRSCHIPLHACEPLWLADELAQAVVEVEKLRERVQELQTPTPSGLLRNATYVTGK